MRLRQQVLLSGLAWLLVPHASLVLAGGSAPLLSLTSATILTSSTGPRTLRVTGAFNFDDLAQFSFPCGVVVVQGTRVVRYDVSGTIVEATALFVADGLTPTELGPLLGLTGTPAAPAALLRLQPDRAMVALPDSLISGRAVVRLYASYDGGAWLSNAISVTLP